ncbi:multicopper oxidase family protein [Mesorhizobium sp. M4B.F.Ca.ET.215.01.1.1]|uniref:multicopper oxidase family protein n=2 Tax=Mesorhizobium TaxID=68287 RepID=UPI000FCB8F17|nr:MULTISPECIES: multicopper oxidase family protein [unclassified Mesorhizobium]RUW24401.1 multicopper oxidase family protein [Mesorhizobium sp. M4B.F.Ca.ET.013.02.1.1]RVD35584.1 multicopper oxidase family protein [Mesorhizobium sp. M4B.F.Ca.ET.019.03.1.1]RWX65548.1 multicopper oxidase family protein [Mesorhizobium sp. M4B.F.Ca.ET.089.01.1.1]TGQ05948.1 multicopper oxidase family protein [Mesorhizobium sp. M4B.F.Ca.ET.215.01.1.1]TGQ31995.1 multicopper oxidase family protein [Mesorhizobium sp. M
MTLTRRKFLNTTAVAGAAGIGLSAMGKLVSRALAGPDPVTLKTARIEAKLMDVGRTRDVLTYGEAGMPPVLRMKKGEPFAARLINGIDDPTTIHWHGIRVPNKMDGVPFLVQPYVYTGDHFDYQFTPPDAGTFWYHPHCNTLEQMGHGLTGVIVVENPNDPQFDAEKVINLRDWRLGDDGQFIDQFRPRDAARAGTYGTVRTANWLDQPQFDAPAGGLVRLRAAITDVTRVYAFRVEGAEAAVIALDGNPVPQRFAPDALQLGPGQRLDLAIRMPDDEGAIVSLRDVRGTKPKILATLRAVGKSLKRDVRDLAPLEANPVAEVDVASAQHISLALSATAENVPADGICGSLGYSFWAINKVPWPGDTPDPTAPLADLKLGRSYVIDMENLTPQSHPIHLHGMSFKVLSSSTRPVQPLVSDTYLIQPDEKVQLGFVADNPGDWLLHCHVIEHQKSGMTSYIRVA